MNILDALITAVMGYGVVFLGIVLLIVVVVIMGKVMVAQQNKVKAAEAAAAAAAPAAPEPGPITPVIPVAPGTAGEVKLYGTSPKDAAMIMAIVADKMGKPINELRFISIKEVK